MRIVFHGAAGGVTGSCHLVEVGTSRVLLDFGLFQGGPHSEALNRRRPRFDPAAVDAVVLSHAHIDHSGRLPLLGRLGSSAPIHCTRGTAGLLGIMLPDSAYLQQHDAARWNRRRAARGRPERLPLYELRDVEECLGRVVTHGYGRRFEAAPGVSVRFLDAGHILGSAIVELELREGTRRVTLVFSGDLGNPATPLLADPARVTAADVLLLESTYGDRNHRSLDETLAELLAILQRAQAESSKVLVPAFAVGRTQDLIYHFAAMSRAGQLKGLPVIVDSPMATATTELYANHPELFDEESRALLERGEDPLDFPGLRFTKSPDESRALNDLRGAAVIISASGMCAGGRIVHHLRHHATRKGCQLVFTGFQAAGTPGRAIVDGHRNIRLFGEIVTLQAQVHTLGGFSAHAGQAQLLSWAGALSASRPKVCLVHGEDRARQPLAAELERLHGYTVLQPMLGDELQL